MTGKHNVLFRPKREVEVFLCYMECMADSVYHRSVVASGKPWQ